VAKEDERRMTKDESLQRWRSSFVVRPSLAVLCHDSVGPAWRIIGAVARVVAQFRLRSFWYFTIISFRFFRA
jgi:hypothetical protein